MSFNFDQPKAHKSRAPFQTQSALPLYRSSRSALGIPSTMSHGRLLRLLWIVLPCGIIMTLLIKQYTVSPNTVEDPLVLGFKPAILDINNFKKQNALNRAPADRIDSLQILAKRPQASVPSKNIEANIEAAELARKHASTPTKLLPKNQDNHKTPTIILVISLDTEKLRRDQLEKVLENRREYAETHGYGLYLAYTEEFKYDYLDSYQQQSSWANLAICRAALAAFPHADWFWFLDQSALIMDPSVDLYKYIINADTLDKQMIKGTPIIPVVGHIKSSTRISAANVSLIMAQNERGMNTKSIIFANNDLSKTLLEFWNDFQYRSYHKFEHADESALNHLLQWHHTFRDHLAIVPAKSIASSTLTGTDNLLYTKGDFVAIFDYDRDPGFDRRFDKFWKGH